MYELHIRLATLHKIQFPITTIGILRDCAYLHDNHRSSNMDSERAHGTNFGIARCLETYTLHYLAVSLHRSCRCK